MVNKAKGVTILIIGHRGACGYAPENTLKSLRKAVELRVDLIEFDVTALSTGELILMHDDSLDRITNGSGFVAHHPFTDLRLLRIEDEHNIITLEEALDFIDKRTKVNIEIKNRGASTLVAKVIENYIEQHGWASDLFLVSSADHIEIKNFKSLIPDIKTGAVISAVPVDYAAFATRANADVAIVDDEMLSQEYVDDAHRRGLEIYVYSFYFEDTNRVRKVADLGADGMYVNYPDKARLELAC